ncbi:FAD-binding oxidoreductase [Ohessyouella blattaphilus]|uniref:D-lactate dehydrogenase (cytochrome) n=1 Tax=Ohessyouella blattaphilus TaxID=2949333 RepID=A0ABT1EGZ6_9FIRM|nr:FAD-binding oxidoreductase [Ohessyouella blattaphilus]MCP1109791.1 FAD-binding oxidoreductase [Ohessyouella blattaphilus]MCR8563185.1 FAD-binding oxidoreductase [Ohessyouella blattaphilus]
MSKEIYPMEEKYQEYLIDESKNLGEATSISFPENEDEVQEIVKTLLRERVPITVQGSMTGIVGGSIPCGGHIMNLQKMKRILSFANQEQPQVTVEAGVSLEELEQGIDRHYRGERYFWPPTPSEGTASIGGILATAARGMNVSYYGDTKKYVSEIQMVDGMGKLHVIGRSSAEESDLLDTIIGSEGLLGIITKATLVLRKRLEESWGITFFFKELDQIDAFVKGLEEIEETLSKCIVATEYADRRALDLVESKKAFMNKIKELPDIEKAFNHLLYLELGGTEERITQTAEVLMNLALECGSDPDKAWAVMGEMEIQKMHAFHHCVAECINLYTEEVRRGDNRITKLEADIALPELPFKECIEFYREEAQRQILDIAIFGHVKGRYLHANILPKNYTEYESGEKLIDFWNREAYEKYGQVAIEHGIGKVKNRLTKYIYTEKQRAQMVTQKQEYDPQQLLNRGNVFSEDTDDKDSSMYEAGASL